MRCFKYIVGLLFLISASGALTEELPVITLEEGANKVTLSVFNNGYKDLTNISVEIDKGKLPVWLTIHENNQIIDVYPGMRGQEQIYLTFDVIDAPSGAYAEIPYTLSDSNGNEWNFTVKVQLDSNNDSSPKTFNALYENFPNPFNPITTISYSIKEDGFTKLIIYNSLGQEIRTLVNDHQEAGIHTVQWDGKNNNGQQVSSGLYLYQFKAGSFVKARRMMLVE